MKLTQQIKTITVAVAVTVAAGSAYAATCPAQSGPQTVIYDVTQGNPDAITDVVCVSNANDTNTIDATYTLFGETGWILANKTDGGGNGNIDYVDAPANLGSTDWSLDNPNMYSEIAITFVQGNSFAAFELDTSVALSGSWTTSGPGGSQQGLSHSSVYYRVSMTPVPIPAAGGLMVFALGGLSLLHRRRKDG